MTSTRTFIFVAAVSLMSATRPGQEAVTLWHAAAVNPALTAVTVASSMTGRMAYVAGPTAVWIASFISCAKR
jgi:hypothetical protein